MMRGFFKRRADAALVKENGRLVQQFAERDSLIRIKDLEIQELAAVVARNLKRVEAETSIAAKTIATSEQAGKHAAKRIDL